MARGILKTFTGTSVHDLKKVIKVVEEHPGAAGSLNFGLWNLAGGKQDLDELEALKNEDHDFISHLLEYDIRKRNPIFVVLFPGT